MSKVQPDLYVARKMNDVEDICFEKCIKNITGRPMRFQEVCIENCLKKVVSGLDFLSRVESVGGMNRSPVVNN